MPSSDADVLDDLVAFLGASPTPYHAVASASARLEARGFGRLDEPAAWDALAPRARHYVILGDSSILAWVQPAGRALRGFRIVGAHTDSPNLRVKPRPSIVREGWEQLGVEVYGGVLLNSWLDRDLALAGRVLVRGADGALATQLVQLRRPLLRVPQLAIHLDREVNDKGLQLNRQQHMAPVVGLAGAEPFDLTGACASELGVARELVAAVDLMLFDTSPPAIGGAKDELLFSARLDNLAMCHAGVTALGEAQAGDVVPLVALFDHEEVGSDSATGAASAFLPRVLERIALSIGLGRDGYLRALAGSLCVSADMAHAVHPAYADRHEPQHKVHLNGGPVVKVNSQQRYATSASTAALFAELCREVDVPVQHYVHRTDLPCGSTIGPIVATQLGVRTVDVGNPMLSMHSARELAGTKDPALMTRVLARFLGTARAPAG